MSQNDPAHCKPRKPRMLQTRAYSPLPISVDHALQIHDCFHDQERASSNASCILQSGPLFTDLCALCAALAKYMNLPAPLQKPLRMCHLFPWCSSCFNWVVSFLLVCNVPLPDDSRFGWLTWLFAILSLVPSCCGLSGPLYIYICIQYIYHKFIHLFVHLSTKKRMQWHSGWSQFYAWKRSWLGNTHVASSSCRMHCTIQFQGLGNSNVGNVGHQAPLRRINTLQATLQSPCLVSLTQWLMVHSWTSWTNLYKGKDQFSKLLYGLLLSPCVCVCACHAHTIGKGRGFHHWNASKGRWESNRRNIHRQSQMLVLWVHQLDEPPGYMVKSSPGADLKLWWRNKTPLRKQLTSGFIQVYS